jgi:hypothetical protein
MKVDHGGVLDALPNMAWTARAPERHSQSIPCVSEDVLSVLNAPAIKAAANCSN